MTQMEKVCDLIAQNRGIDVSGINAETSFEDLGFDSLDTVELIMEFEEKFGVNFDEAGGIKTVGEAVAYIENAIK